MGSVTWVIGRQLMPLLGAAPTLAIQLVVGIALYAGLVPIVAPDLARRLLRQIGGLPLLGRLFV